MSRVPKWKVEKTKVKVVFRLQFQATNIPPGWDKLFLSFVPSDTGKASAKTTKANVRNGNCKWSDPIYETTRLIQDTRTKKYDEKLYKLVIAMGSSRSSLLGEVNINLADFADASKPSSFQLPLQSCDFGTVLHATVQLLTSKTGFREFEQQREAATKGFQIISDQRSPDPAATLVEPSDMANEQIEKVNARVMFKEGSVELPSFEVVRESNEDSGAGIGGPSYISGSSNTEKNDISNIHLVDKLRSRAGDASGSPPNQKLSIEKQNQNARRLPAQVNHELAYGFRSDYSADNDIAPAYEENNKLRVRLEVAESAFLQLKLEADSLQSITDELGAETQNLTQQLATELASGEKLAREVSLIKSEYSEIKNDLEDVKSAKTLQHNSYRSLFSVINAPFNGLLEDRAVATGQNSMPHDAQLKCLQGISLIEGKVREIQSKACLEYRGGTVDLHTDFEALEYVIQNLKEGITQISSVELVDGTRSNNIQTTQILPSGHVLQGQGLETCYRDHIPEGVSHFLSSSDEVSHETEASMKNLGSTRTEEKMCELLERLQESSIERENLTRKMDQMECYYEALIQELELSHKQTLKDLENLRAEHDSSLYTVSALQSQIDKMHQDMDVQLIRFAEDMHSLETQNKEFEKRANASDATLARVRSNYSTAVDRLQKDLELLSFQVMSMYETSENVAKQSCTDESQLPEHHPDECSEEAHLCMQKSRFILSDKEEFKSSLARTSPEAVHIKYELPYLQNGVLDTVSFKAIHCLDFTEGNNGFSETSFPRNVELQIHDKGDAHVNALKLQNTRQVSPEIQRNGEIPNRSNLNWEIESLTTDAGPDSQPLEHELSEMHACNMHSEVFSLVLQETLRDVINGFGYMKDQINQLKQNLEQSTDAKLSLMLRLHTALDDAHLLRENETKITTKSEDLMLENHCMEAKIRDLLEENSYITQKVVEYETLTAECRDFESKYKACNEERKEIEHFLKQESLDKICLQSEIGCITEDFKALKEQLDAESSANDGLKNTLNLLEGKLQDLYFVIVSYSQKINISTLGRVSLQQEPESKNSMTMVLLLEQFHEEVCTALLELSEEKKGLEEQRNIAQHSLLQTEAHILFMNQKFESELKEITTKFDESGTASEKLRVELHEAAEKLKNSSEAEEKNRIQNRALLTKLADLEVQLQHATDENRDLDQKLLLLEATNEELKETNINSMQENRTLLLSIQSRNEASIQMEDELSSLRESLRHTHEKLHIEGELREEVEAQVADLTLHLQKLGQELLSFDEQKAELVQLRQKILELETVNNSLQNIISQSEESLGKLREQHEAEVVNFTSQLDRNFEKLSYFDEQNAELLCVTKRISVLERECTGLQHLLSQSEESQVTLREQHEAEVADLTSQLEKKVLKLLTFDEQNADLLCMTTRISELEIESNRLQHLLSQSEERQGKLREQHEAEVSDLTSQLEKKVQQLLSFDAQSAELLRIAKRISDLETENNNLQHLLSQSGESQGKLIEQYEAEVADLTSQLAKKVQKLLSFDEQIAELLRVTKRISDLETENNSLQHLLSQSEESQGKLQEQHEAEVADLASQLEKKARKLQFFEKQNDQLLHIIKKIPDIETENRSLQHLPSQSEESQGNLREQPEAEFDYIASQVESKFLKLLSFDELNAELRQISERFSDLEKENIRLQRLLSQSEKEQVSYREDLEAEVADLKSELKKKGLEILSFEEQNVQVVHLRERTLVLETENFQIQHLLSQTEEIRRKLDGELLLIRLHVSEMENHLAEFLECSLARDVEVVYMKTQFNIGASELIDQTKTIERNLRELHMSQLNIIASLEACKASEAQLVDENRRLSAALQFLKSECDSIACEKETLVDNLSKTNISLAEFEDMKAIAATLEAQCIREKRNHADEISQLNAMLMTFEKEVENLWSSRAELEITQIFLTSILDEQKSRISYLEVCDCDLRNLREQHKELSYKLSEQIMKTEEFKNLSNHLRELKDKAETESRQTREKRENGGPSHVMQESLRIAFIKEQYETKLLELRSQLNISKNHAEEMLLKLQNALNEAESGKKSEISLVKQNEELSTKVLKLETELQTSVTDRRELGKAYDRMKAELECTTLSLDCCKEEKLKLEGTLQECNEERTKIRVELDLVKRLLENMASVTDMHENGDLEPGSPIPTSIGQLLKDNPGFAVVSEEIPSTESACPGNETIHMDNTNHAISVDTNQSDDGSMLNPCKELEYANSACVNGSAHSSLDPNLQSLQEDFIYRSSLEQESLSKDNKRQTFDLKAHREEQKRLRSGMDHLLKELERLKNENLTSLLPLEESALDPALQGLQRELAQLDMANEHLESIYPLFKELPVNGNSLERVLALELELAESLQAKKKTDDRFQSSFLKQHGDEEAVYQSFRDINDLIKDMLELKKKNTIVEAELKEMHGRYSQLSLKFAEVEGERQKLVMTLKSRSLRRS